MDALPDLFDLSREEAMRLLVERSNALRRDGRLTVLVGTNGGYAAVPGSGPAGETCRSCCHAVARRLSRKYWKCDLMRAYWTGGARTDIKLKSPACARWKEKNAEEQ